MEEKAPVKKVFKKAPRKKVCAFCQEKLDAIDYKDVNRLKKFITEGGIREQMTKARLEYRNKNK